MVTLLGFVSWHGKRHDSGNDAPSWDPAWCKTYTFEQWSRDVLKWSIASEKDPRRKAAQLAHKLEGEANDFIDSMSPEIYTRCCIVGGVQMDPMGFIMHTLANQFGPMSDDVQQAATWELI